jgi:nitrite reductase (NADH) large subunit
MPRYVIIGTGVAGIAAVEAIRSRDARGDIVMIGDESHGFYSRPGLAYYLTGELGEEFLYPQSQGDLQKLNLRRIHARVVRIHPQAHQVELHDGARMAYQRLLIATGARAARLGIHGAELEGVVKLDNLDDARRILKLVRKARLAVVVGGGITALEIVEGLRARRVETHYLLRGDRYWSNVLDETESQIILERLREEGVRIHPHTELEAILGKRGRVVGVRAKDGSALKCNLVAIAIGIRPRKELAAESGLRVERGILVDEHMRASAADVFAAGDVAQVYDPLTGKHILDSLWGPARNQGEVAGSNMTGYNATYEKPPAFNVTRLANLTTTIIGTVNHGQDEDLLGIARGDSETWRQLPDAIAAQADFDVNRLRVMVGKDKLLGAIVMGDQTLSRPLQNLVTQRVDITPIREALLQPEAPLADILTDFWIEWKNRS